MRTVVVTGAATGIGAATRERLEKAGCRVIGVGVADCEVNVDLSVPEGRQRAVAEVLDRSGGVIDGYVASAGLSRNSGDERKVLAVNFFGCFEPLLGLREALAKSDAPAAVLVSSWGMLRPWAIPEAIDACLAMDEARALDIVGGSALAGAEFHLRPAHATSKAAMGRMARHLCWQPEWAGEGITINVIAPSVTRTPMTEVDFAMPGGTERLLKASPSPMNRIATPDEMADMICFFAEGRGRYVSGQVIFVDAGLDARRRPDDPILPLPLERWT
jgi:NAD(P)-dependent dehydrogenase (short-subunit alcohol dehydrogenase family)